VTNVRTIGTVASTHGGAMKRTLGRRAKWRRSALETLEGRRVPSTTAVALPMHVDLPDGYHGVAEVDSAMSADAFARGRMAPRPSSSGGLDVPGRTPRSGDRSVPGTSVDVSSNAETVDETKRPPLENVVARDLTDSLMSAARRIDPTSEPLAGDPASSESEMMSGLGGGAGSATDSATATSVVGWAPGASMPVTMSAAVPRGPVVSPDGRGGAPAVEIRTAGSVANVVPELEGREPAPSDAATASGMPGVEPTPLPLAVRLSVWDRDPPGWANVLEGGLRPEWEAVDRELRQFLSGLGGLVQQTDEPGTGPAWPLWIGAATALVLARRASSDRRRLFRRAVPGAFWVSPRRLVPVNPWPMGPP